MIKHHSRMFTALVAVIGMICPFRSTDAQGVKHMQYAASMKIDERGVPRAMYNLSVATTQRTPELAARSFVIAHQQKLQIANAAADLAVQNVLVAPGGTHVRFTQNFNGIPVYGADVVVSLNAGNQVTMVVNNSRADVEAPATPALSAEKAVAIAQNYLHAGAHPTGQADAAALTVFADEQGAYHLAYRVTMTRENPAGDWEILVDALSGTVLQSRDMFVNYDEGQRINGHGYVYLSDPLSAAHKKYGSPGFTDDNDRDTDSLDAYRSLVTLDSITFAGGVFSLRGPCCTITDIESPVDSLFVSDSPDGFMFNRSQQGFEAVNAYYHVSQAYKRLRDLGFSSSRLEQIRIDPHGFQGQDNSHYSPVGNWISFGTGGVDDAEDADVIWHEYGHAIQYSFSPSWGGGESAILGEGYSDYWAASHSRSLNQWSPADEEYTWVYKWDGHNEYWAGRVVNDPHTYPFENPSPHISGQVWSSALMGIHGDLGRDVTDRLVLKSLFYLGYGATGVDAAYAIIQADRDLYNGSHLATLIYWLGTVKRFIDPASIQNLATGVAEEHSTTPASFMLSQNYPNPFNPTTTIPFSLTQASQVHIRIFTLLGQEVRTLAHASFAAGTHEVVWDGSAHDGRTAASGVYLCRMDVTPGDGSAPLSFTRKMVLVR
jgi:hypothetical protein